MKYVISPIILNYKRLCLLCICMFLIFIMLGVRLIYLQYIMSDRLISESDKRSLRVQYISQFRGMITDRVGRILAISIPVNSIWIDPEEVYQSGGINSNICNWIKLSKILNISLEKLMFLINNSNRGRFLYLSRQLDPIIAECIIKLNIPGVYTRQELKRYYPAGASAAHIVGVTNIDNQGIEGIEKSFDSWLSGVPKIKMVRQDRLGRVIDDVSLLNPGISPKNIILSIDKRLQYFAYHELNKAVTSNNAESGSIILIDIKTGEVLAMANSPSYDPNDLATVSTAGSMRNRAITDVFEPGSTIKPIVVMTALQHKIVDKYTTLSTVPYVINGHRIKDVSFYDKLSISEILQKSSNVGVSKLALSMPISALINAYLNFGMGKVTNIELLGENKGKIYPCNRYCSAIERATLSYGYGLMLTPLQLAKIYTTIANMGVSRPLSIIKINNADSIISSPENQIFSKSLIRTVVDMMEVTTVSNSGCYQAAIHGYRVAVKTGTVKKVGSNGKYINKYISCIAGIAPSTNPRFALVVVINDPKNGCYYGGLISAPVFKSVMSNTLKVMNINPDF